MSLASLTLWFTLLIAAVGCEKVASVSPLPTWHEKFNWQAEDIGTHEYSRG